MSRFRGTAYGAGIAVALIGLAGTVFQAAWPDLAQALRVYLGIQAEAQEVTVSPSDIEMDKNQTQFDLTTKILSPTDMHLMDRSKLDSLRLWYALYVGPETSGDDSVKYQVVVGPFDLGSVGTPIQFPVPANLEQKYWGDQCTARLVVLAAPKTDHLESGIVPEQRSDIFVLGSAEVSSPNTEAKPDCFK